MTAKALPLWPAERAGEALIALARAAELSPREGELGASPSGAEELGSFLVAAGSWLGVEVEAVSAPYEDVAKALGAMAPGLVRVPDGAGAGLLLVLGATKRRLTVIDRALRAVQVPIADVAAALCRDAVAPALAAVAPLVDRAALQGGARDRALGAMIGARLRGKPIGGLYILRRPLEASTHLLARDRGFTRRLGAVLALHAAAQMLWLGSWWAIGRSVLGGAVSAGWIAGWALLIASAQAARVAVGWWTGTLAADAGALLSQRLLAGALRTDPQVLKRDGVGVALGRVLESSTLQTHAIAAGVGAFLALIEIVLAAVVLGLGAGGFVHLCLLAATLVAGAVAARSYVHARRTWTAKRFELTHQIGEAMVGHATRLAQGNLNELSGRDDRALVRYLVASRAVDRAQRRLTVLIPMGWPVLAAVGLAPALAYGAPTAGALATALGGVLFAAEALGRLTEGVVRLTDVGIAWRSIRELFLAAATPPAVAPPSLALAAPSSTAPALAARGIGFRHPGRGAPVLADCDLVLGRGDRVLLEGPSGTGKSTLAGILAGLRRPESGLVLASGLDRASVGALGWCRRVACAPQFHDNHVFSGPLAFNLLMGRSWPPSRADYAEAEAVCRELGLGPLIERMPAGLMEQVGETGWQLSQGERSRVFLARALLQGADVVLLDESLAALDPENLAIALGCIEARAPAAIVIAHP